MRTSKPQALPARVAALRRRFDPWRESRTIGSRIPERPWLAGDRPRACLAWSSAPRHLGCRDRFLGWSAVARGRNIHLPAYNLRFLILPWIDVPHLASHPWARMARRPPRDWRRMYGHPVYVLETFVDSERFRGSCYRAANWILLGGTTARGKADRTHRPNRPIKKVWGYPLRRHFRQRLCRKSEPTERALKKIILHRKNSYFFVARTVLASRISVRVSSTVAK